MADALELVPSGKPVVAYDLGAGIGRHTIPLLRELPGGSDVFAVDLLPSALRALETAVPPGIRTHLHTRPADLDGFEFEAPADLILAFSAIEHPRDLKTVRRLLDQVRAATKPGGIVAIGIVADRVEVDDHGNQRPALLESAMSTADATELLTRAFSGAGPDPSGQAGTLIARPRRCPARAPAAGLACAVPAYATTSAVAAGNAMGQTASASRHGTSPVSAPARHQRPSAANHHPGAAQREPGSAGSGT